MRTLLSGGVAAGAFVVALFFLRFWRTSADRLFLWFSIGFALMGANHVGLGLTDVDDESRLVLYAIRFCAFVLILIAIADKNRQRE